MHLFLHQSQIKKRKKQKVKYADIVSEELRSIRVGMDAVVAALDRNNLQKYIKQQLFKEIVKIGEMSDVSHMKTYQALIGDVSASRAFLACPIDRHKLWLSVKFGPFFFMSNKEAIYSSFALLLIL